MTRNLEHKVNTDSEIDLELLRRIETYLRASGTPPTRFGRDALGDPGFVTGLRNGREPRSVTVRRVETYLDELEKAGADQARRLAIR